MRVRTRYNPKKNIYLNLHLSVCYSTVCINYILLDYRYRRMKYATYYSEAAIFKLYEKYQTSEAVLRRPNTCTLPSLPEKVSIGPSLVSVLDTQQNFTNLVPGLRTNKSNRPNFRHCFTSHLRKRQAPLFCQTKHADGEGELKNISCLEIHHELACDNGQRHYNACCTCLRRRQVDDTRHAAPSDVSRQRLQSVLNYNSWSINNTMFKNTHSITGCWTVEQVNIYWKKICSIFNVYRPHDCSGLDINNWFHHIRTRTM